MRIAWIVLLLVGCGFQSPVSTIDDETGGEPDTPDASFDYARCPGSYNVSLPGPSRYRLITAGHPVGEQSDACNQDLPGATHLVVIETPKELTDVEAFVRNLGPGTAGNALWIGGVQRRTAVLPSDAWLGFDGNPLIHGWGGGEPNDKGGGESQHDEQFVKMQKDKPYFIDATGTDAIGALCECDGKAVATSAVEAFLASRPLLPPL